MNATELLDHLIQHRGAVREGTHEYKFVCPRCGGKASYNPTLSYDGVQGGGHCWNCDFKFRSDSLLKALEIAEGYESAGVGFVTPYRLAQSELEQIHESLQAITAKSLAMEQITARGLENALHLLAEGGKTTHSILNKIRMQEDSTAKPMPSIEGLLFIPILNNEGKLTSLKYRLKKPVNGAKYMYPKGCAAVPWHSPGFSQYLKIVITEGELNAIAGYCTKLQYGFMGVAGKSNKPSESVSGKEVYLYADKTTDRKEVLARWAEYCYAHGANAVYALPALPDHNNKKQDFCDLNARGELLGWLSRELIQAERIPAPLGQVVDLENGIYIIPDVDHFESYNSDYANALRIEANLKTRIRYTTGLGWLMWEGKRWVIDADQTRVTKRTMNFLIDFYRYERMKLSTEVRKLDPDDSTAKQIEERIKTIATNIKSVQKLATVRSALDTARGHMTVDIGEWDSKPYLLNVQNGVLDLKTGKLYPHNPEYLITKLAGCDYNPAASHKTVNAVLNLVNQDGKLEFVKRTLGTALYGANDNEVFWVFQGKGGTGKGTLLGSAIAVLGDYGKAIDINTILESKKYGGGGDARADLLDLRGLRLAVASESDKGAKLSAGLVKQLTGNDEIRARALYSNTIISFKGTFNLIIQTNNPLAMPHDDTGLHRRVKIVPFLAEPKKRDPKVKTTLEKDSIALSAMLNFMYEGFRNWQENDGDLGETEAVQTATNAYWEEQNPFKNFFEDCLVFGQDCRASRSQIRQAYEQHLDHKASDEKLTELYNALLRSGCIPSKYGGARVFKGVGILE